jgi:hypothetical protein
MFAAAARSATRPLMIALTAATSVAPRGPTSSSAAKSMTKAGAIAPRRSAADCRLAPAATTMAVMMRAQNSTGRLDSSQPSNPKRTPDTTAAVAKATVRQSRGSIRGRDTRPSMRKTNQRKRNTRTVSAGKPLYQSGLQASSAVCVYRTVCRPGTRSTDFECGSTAAATASATKRP